MAGFTKKLEWDDGDEEPSTELVVGSAGERQELPPGVLVALYAKEHLAHLSLADLLEKGRRALIQGLVAKAELGIIKPSETAVLRNILLDNGLVDLAPNPNGAPTITLKPTTPLPKFDPPEYYDGYDH